MSLDENEKLRTEIINTYLDNETAGAKKIIKLESETGDMIAVDHAVEYIKTSDNEFDVKLLEAAQRRNIPIATEAIFIRKIN